MPAAGAPMPVESHTLMSIQAAILGCKGLLIKKNNQKRDMLSGRETGLGHYGKWKGDGGEWMWSICMHGTFKEWKILLKMRSKKYIWWDSKSSQLITLGTVDVFLKCQVYKTPDC